ncbi:MAG: oxidoreductase domain protein [Acidimicrobiaceae bacterium]|nr:oxidoreductase domain protein [Acidimicrobiaceae bacterium]
MQLEYDEAGRDGERRRDREVGSQTRVGIVGAGFMAAAHAAALQRLPNVDVIAVASPSPARRTEFANVFEIPLALGDWRSLVENSEVDVVHNCTPAGLHTEVNLAAVSAGKHILCEKPLATSSTDAFAVTKAAEQRGVITGVCFNYRYYSATRQLKELIASGRYGSIHQVHGGYLQDWLLRPSDDNWRLDPDIGGPSTAIADIGSHWFDLVEHLTGDTVSAVCADLGTLRPISCRRADGVVEKPNMANDEFGSILATTVGGTRIAAVFSQVSAGNKNRLHVEFDTSEASLAWDQESPNQLRVGRHEEPSQVWERNPDSAAGLLPALPSGHPEGWNDALIALCADFHGAVRARRSNSSSLMPTTHPSLRDGLRMVQFTEAVLASHAKRGWVDLDPAGEPATLTQRAEL